MELAEAFISFVCLVSLIVILLEARRSGGLRRRLPVALWAFSLVLLAVFALLRVVINLDAWSDARILMGILGVGNFLFGSALLVRWMVWTTRNPTGGGERSR
jgi:hypothetical protein